jgi:hypothetical protein
MSDVPRVPGYPKATGISQGRRPRGLVSGALPWEVKAWC